MRGRICGTGSYLPEKYYDNNDIAKIVETSDAWIRERTGIVRRHIASGYETTVSMAVEAGRRALENGHVLPEEIDMILVSTITPNAVIPGVAFRFRRLWGQTGQYVLISVQPAADLSLLIRRLRRILRRGCIRQFYSSAARRCQPSITGRTEAAVSCLVTAPVQPLFRLKKESFILRLQALMAPWVMYWPARAACRMTGSRRKQTVRPTLIWMARQFLSLR